MLPLISSHLTTDLAHEHLERRLRVGRRPYRYDPDHFVDAPAALHPDPVFIGLHRVVFDGPIGRLVQWFERWAEAREDRALNGRIDAAVERPQRLTIAVLPASKGDGSDDERTAA